MWTALWGSLFGLLAWLRAQAMGRGRVVHRQILNHPLPNGTWLICTEETTADGHSRLTVLGHASRTRTALYLPRVGLVEFETRESQE